MEGVALENLQARIRGTILMEYSNRFGHLLLTTGNKSEISVGYCTLYGDTNGGLGVIGDLYKTEVFGLCRHLNASAGREIIPLAIIDKPPSAELAPGQKDTDSLPPYEVLDEVLKVLIEGERLGGNERTQAERKVGELNASAEGRALDHAREENDRAQRIQAPPGAAHPARARPRLRQRTADAHRRALSVRQSMDTQVAVIIGRWQILQKGHVALLRAALASCAEGGGGHRFGLARARCAQPVYLDGTPAAVRSGDDVRTSARA